MTGNYRIYSHLLKAYADVMLDLAGYNRIATVLNVAVDHAADTRFKGTALNEYFLNLVAGIIDGNYPARA